MTSENYVVAHTKIKNKWKCHTVGRMDKYCKATSENWKMLTNVKLNTTKICEVKIVLLFTF